MASAEKMEMKMPHRLTAVGTGIYDDSIAMVEPLGPGEFCGGGHQIAQQRSIFRRCVGQRCDVNLGNNQQMSGCLGVDVGEGEDAIILEDAPRRDGSGYDSAEETIGTVWDGLLGHAAILRPAWPDPVRAALRAC